LKKDLPSQPDELTVTPNSEARPANDQETMPLGLPTVNGAQSQFVLPSAQKSLRTESVLPAVMADSGRVSDNSAVSAEYEAVKGVNLEKCDRFKHLLSWYEKQSLFKWKGSLEELQNFSKETLECDESPTVCISDRSSSLKSKLVTLVLFNNTGTLQIKGTESTVIKNDRRKLLSLPVHEESVILVSEEKPATRSFMGSWII